MQPAMTNMEMHGIGYIAYAIALHLQAYAEHWDNDSIDDMWDNIVYPWAVEFYNTPEYKDNINDEPFMEALNKFVNAKMFEWDMRQKEKAYNVYRIHMGVRFTKDIFVKAANPDEAKELLSCCAEDVSVRDMEYASTDYDVIDVLPPDTLVSGVCLCQDVWYHSK